jgi:uncharacterized peroxidase-related enzyme
LFGSYSEVMAHTLKGVDPAQDPVIAELEKKTGPNHFVRLLALKPEAVQPFLGLFKAAMGSGSLDRRLKEMVYLAVCNVNECTYCGSHHEKAARKAGVSDTEIRAILTETNQDFTPKEQAALRYARELTRNADVEDDTRERVRDLFSNDQIVELTLVVSMANFTNRFSNSLAIPVES